MVPMITNTYHAAAFQKGSLCAESRSNMRLSYQFKKALATPLIIALFASPLHAQHPARPDIVAEQKAALIVQGADLSGPCGAFKITKAVAWRLSGEGVGLLAKEGGNNCDGYSVDFVTYADGSGVDILGDAGGANVPGWDVSEPVGALLGRWRAPIPPNATPVPQPQPIPQPQPNPDGPALTLLQQTLNEFRQEFHNETIANRAEHAAMAAKLEKIDNEPGWFVKTLGNHWVQLGLATVTTYVTTKQVTKE